MGHAPASGPAPAPRRRGRGVAVAGIAALVVGGAVAAAVLTLRAGGANRGATPPVAAASTVEPRTQATIDRGGGAITSDGIRIVFPPGAVTAGTDVRVGVLTAAPPSPDANLIVVSPVWDLDAGPGVFDALVEVAIAYDPTRLPTGRTAADLIGVLATDTGYTRLPVAAVDPDRHVVTLRLPHFSRPAIAVLASPSRIVKRHPSLPFDIAVVDAYPPKDPAMVDVLYRSLERAYRSLTPHGTRPEPFPAPPAGADERLLVEVTALDYLRTLYAGGFTPSGVAHSHDLLQIDYRELTPGTPWDAAVHEFFHAIQWTYRERALRDGARGRWSGFIAEATANWAAQVVAPAYTNGDVALDPEFCFVPLVYDPFAVGDPEVTHAYAGAIFMHYLTARLGGGAVNRVLGQAYQDATDDTQVLERAIRELDPSASLDSLYRQFVIDVLFHQRVGARALHDRPADTLKVPERMVTTLAIGPAGDQPVRVTRELTGRRHAVAGVIKVVPTVPSGTRQTLTAELGGASWLWAIAEDAAGKQRVVGGGASVRLTVDDQVRAVWLLPVSFADAALPLAVRMERSTRLAWKRTQVEISPPGGAIARSDDVSSLSGTVTERSITTTEVFAATGNRNTFTLSWTPPPERLEEGVPFAMELTGTAAGSSKIMSSFLVLAEDARGSATFETEGHPNVTLSLDLHVGVGLSDHAASATERARFTPRRSPDPDSDNRTLALQVYSANDAGVVYLYELE